jgi:hypothetical protein
MATVILQNNHWDSVSIQVKQGNYANPDQNPDMDQATLAKHESVSYDTMENIMFRRELQPGSNHIGWSNWQNIPVYTFSTVINREIL